MGEGRKSALISEVLGQDVHSKGKKGFQIGGELVEGKEKEGEGQQGAYKGTRNVNGKHGESRKRPPCLRALEVGSRYCRLQGVGRIDYSSHVGTRVPPGSVLQPLPSHVQGGRVLVSPGRPGSQ